jgi:ubiquinone/menaquinone biosynthesis C-methylase UbiE
MPLFRRNQSHGRGAERDRSASSAAETRSLAADEDLEWRSFDTVAGAYARFQAPQHAAVAADLVELLEIQAGARVLDVGTGTGPAARAAAAAAGSEGLVVGIDPSVPMLQQASNEGKGPRYAAAGVVDLPFRDGTFGFELAGFVLGALPNYQTALFDMLRVLAAGGRLGLATWGPGDDQDEFSRTWRQAAEEFAEHEILQDARDRALPWEELFSDRDRAKDALHDAGLRDIWIEKRTYHFETTVQDYLSSREISAEGRFLRRMLGEEFWQTFHRRAEEAFRERFPERFNDFREAVLIVGHKP